MSVTVVEAGVFVVGAIGVFVIGAEGVFVVVGLVTGVFVVAGFIVPVSSFGVLACRVVIWTGGLLLLCGTSCVVRFHITSSPANAKEPKKQITAITARPFDFCSIASRVSSGEI